MSLLANTTYANPKNPFWIAKVEAGPGVSVTGPDYAPTISSTGVLTVSAGNGLSNVGTAQDPILQNEGILAVTPGTGISVSPGQDATITNEGILTVTAGDGIDITPGQDPIITNSGVINITNGPGISIGGSQSYPVINNPDFFRNSFSNVFPSLTQTATTEIILFTTNFNLVPSAPPNLTTYIHAFSFNNYQSGLLPLTTGSYVLISRILPQGIAYPGVVSNLLIQGTDVLARGIMQPFTTTGASAYTYELRVLVTGSGTLRLRNIETKVFRVS